MTISRNSEQVLSVSRQVEPVSVSKQRVNHSTLYFIHPVCFVPLREQLGSDQLLPRKANLWRASQTPHGLSVVWRRDFCLLSLFGDPEGSCNSTLWTFLLFGLYPESLGQREQQGSVQLPPMQADLQASADTGKEHAPSGSYGEAQDQ